MADGETTTPKAAVAAAIDSSSTANAAVAKDTQSVPLQALLDTRQRARSAEEELAALKADMESLKQRLAASPAPAQAPVDQQARELLSAIQNERAASRLQSELGLSSAEQVSLVQDVLKNNAGLTAAEALGIAEKRKPELFNAAAPQGFDPATHGTMRPRPAGQPAKTEAIEENLSEFHKKARELPLGRVRQEFMDKRIGNLARNALGLGRLNHK